VSVTTTFPGGVDEGELLEQASEKRRDVHRKRCVTRFIGRQANIGGTRPGQIVTMGNVRLPLNRKWASKESRKPARKSWYGRSEWSDLLSSFFLLSWLP
jgi:hypothetical protein